MTDWQVVTVACRRDNYAYIVHDGTQGATLVVDAPEAEPIVAALDDRGLALDAVFLTHHHADHTDGVAALAARYRPRIYGAAVDEHRLPPLDGRIAEGDRVEVGALKVAVMATPGHTSGHLCFHLAREGLVFTADTLFSLGCGRLFEGRPADMWMSLMRLKALPEDTAVYPGHEYTLQNGRFAVTVDPDNAALRRRLAEVEELREAGKPTVPTTIGLEKATNPLFRADDPAIARRLGLAGRPPVEVFAEIRRLKDHF